MSEMKQVDLTTAKAKVLDRLRKQSRTFPGDDVKHDTETPLSERVRPFLHPAMYWISEQIAALESQAPRAVPVTERLPTEEDAVIRYEWDRHEESFEPYLAVEIWFPAHEDGSPAGWYPHMWESVTEKDVWRTPDNTPPGGEKEG